MVDGSTTVGSSEVKMILSLKKTKYFRKNGASFLVMVLNWLKTLMR